MKRALFIAAAALALSSAAFAEDDVMASRYGNTTVVTRADGTVIKLWYNADHTWSGDMGGMAVGGTWKVENGTLCVTYNGTLPPGAVNPNCSPAMARAVGDHWSVGEGAAKMDATLAAGKQ